MLHVSNNGKPNEKGNCGVDDALQVLEELEKETKLLYEETYNLLACGVLY